MASFRHALTRHSWWIALVWLAVGVITAAQVVAGMAALGRQHNNWVSVFLTTAAASLIWLPATHGPRAEPAVSAGARRGLEKSPRAPGPMASVSFMFGR